MESLAMKNAAIAVLLAEGFEEIEAVTPIDVLRRLEFSVVVAGVGGCDITGAHGLRLATDVALEDLRAEELAALVLPGGMPGAVNLRDNPKVIELVRAVHAAGKPVCAICAAPIVLAAAGLTPGKTVTGYPMALLKEALADANYTGNLVETDGTVITGKGPGAAFAFAFAIAAALGKAAAAEQMLKTMFVSR
jgi:4-methyl-5(b-hydroxyethyl)-thiazole monophosphate biosynthesis